MYFLPSSQSLETLVYQNFFVQVLALSVIAMLGEMYFRRSCKWNIVFFVLTGLCFAAFWNLREDSIWLMPVFLVGCIITAVQMSVGLKLQVGKFFHVKLLLVVIPREVFVADPHYCHYHHHPNQFCTEQTLGLQGWITPPKMFPHPF